MADALATKELFQAAQQNDFAVVSERLQRLAVLDERGAREAVASLVEAKTKNSLLHYACDNGNLDACKFLLMCDGMADAFLNEINAFGHTPLFYAASSGRLPLVKWLVSNGADIDTDYSDRPEIEPRDGDQGIFTALQIASFKGHADVANFLVECNAELSGTRRNGKTALHFASTENHPAVVKILLDAGADVHACDDQGKSPVDVAPASILPLLLPSEFPGQNDAGEEETEMEHCGSADDDTDDSFTSADYEQVALVKNAFGADVGRAFRSSNWKERVGAINEANLTFQSVQSLKNAIKLFDAANVVIERALQDAVSQVVSACCTSLLRSAFGAAMSDKTFHSPQFHKDRPVIARIASSLMSRGAGSNEKDASEAVASLLFLICKSADLTRFTTSQIAGMFTAAESSSATALSPAKTITGEGQSASTLGAVSSWRHQLVAIKVLNAIASQYRLDEASSGLHFAGAVKVSLQGLDNSSVHVRSAAIDLLVQSVLIRCEQSEMTGTAEQMYEQMKSWTESIFRQQNQTLKPSIQAKINTGLRNALQQSKRLASVQTDGMSGDTVPGLSIAKVGTSNDKASAFVDPAAALSPHSKSAQKEDELPYAEPISEAQREEVGDLVAFFGEKATRCLLSNAWAPRVEGLSFLQYQIETRLVSFDKKHELESTRSLVKALQKVLVQALQDRVNSVFEAGVSLLMEVAISFNNAVDSTSDVALMHDLIRPLIPRLLVKFGDSKSRLHVTTEDALLLLSRQFASIGPELLLEEMIASDRNASPQALSATYLANKLGLISKLLLEFGVKESPEELQQPHALPIKNVLQPALQACEHRDQSVRQVALQIIADALQAARGAAMPFLDALARSSRQKLISRLVDKGALEADMLMEEVDDFDVSNETSASRPGTSGGVRPPTASGSSTKHRPVLSNTSLSAGAGSATGGGGGQASSSSPAPLPYGTALTPEQKEAFATIIQGFGEEIVRCLLDKAWAQREAAVREVERQVVGCASGKIPTEQALPKTLETLGNLARVLELGLNDTVARVFQCSLRLFQVLVTDFLPLLSSSHEFVDEILENVVGLVLQKLGDTKQRIRQDCSTLLHSMASLGHVGHARMCKMLSEKYQQLAAASPSVASSALVIGELLKLLTVLVKEEHASSAAASTGSTVRPDMERILSVVGPALDNKHVDVRNAAVATYIAVFEVTSGGADDAYGRVDLNGLIDQAKPAIRDAISRSIVQIKKTLPSGMDSDGDGGSTMRPEVDSARRQPVSIDTHKLAAVCSSEIVDSLTSSSSSQRCEGVDKLVAHFLASPQHPSLKGSWEISCLLTKQLLADSSPTVCLAAFDLLRLLADPPGTGAVAAEFAIPWGEWGVHLVLGSTVRSVVQQSASESVRVRSQVKSLLQLIAGRHSVGKSAVCNALLSAPEQRDPAAAGTSSDAQPRKVEAAKLRWQFMLRLELLHEFLVEAARLEDAIATADLGRRRSAGGSAASSSTKQATDALSVENLVPFLGSAVSHPSPTVRGAAHRIMQHLKATRDSDVAKFIQTGCSPALQKRVQLLLADDFGGVSSSDCSDGNEGSNVVRGSRASHVRRIAALRPPRSVPVEEKQLMVDVFPPPQSAPGNGRRPSGANHQDQNDDDHVFGSKNANYVVTAARDRGTPGSGQHQQDEQQTLPIWLDQAVAVSAASSSRKGVLSFDGDSDSIVGGGTAGLMKMRRKSGVRNRNNNGDGGDELLFSRQGIY